MKDAMKPIRTRPQPPRYSHRVQWRRANHPRRSSKFFERLENAERFADDQARRTDLHPLLWIHIERREVGPWSVVDGSEEF